jgi:hypothetical protein
MSLYKLRLSKRRSHHATSRYVRKTEKKKLTQTFFKKQKIHLKFVRNSSFKLGQYFFFAREARFVC